MRLTLSMLAAVAALGLGTVPASAQTAPNAPPPAVAPADAGNEAAGHHHHHHRNPYMRALRSLALTDAQKAQIKALVQAAHQKDRGVTDPAVRRADAQALHAQIEAVLTPDQRAQLQAKLAAMRAQPHPPERNEAGEAPGSK